MYIFGGCAHKRPLLNDLYILDLKTMMFERVETGSHLPSARTWHAAVVVRNQMYVFGGVDGDEKRLNDTVVFDMGVCQRSIYSSSCGFDNGWNRLE